MRSRRASLRRGSTPTSSSRDPASAADERGATAARGVRSMGVVVSRLAQSIAGGVLAALLPRAAAQQLQFEPFRFAGQPLISQPPFAGQLGYPMTGDLDGDGRNDLVIVSDWGLSVDYALGDGSYVRSEERRVGKEW